MLLVSIINNQKPMGRKKQNIFQAKQYELPCSQDPLSENFYQIEKVLKEGRTPDGVQMCFVSWVGYSSEYNSWVKKETVMPVEKLLSKKHKAKEPRQRSRQKTKANSSRPKYLEGRKKVSEIMKQIRKSVEKPKTKQALALIVEHDPINISSSQEGDKRSPVRAHSLVSISSEQRTNPKSPRNQETTNELQHENNKTDSNNDCEEIISLTGQILGAESSMYQSIAPVYLPIQQKEQQCKQNVKKKNDLKESLDQLACFMDDLDEDIIGDQSASIPQVSEDEGEISNSSIDQMSEDLYCPFAQKIRNLHKDKKIKKYHRQ